MRQLIIARKDLNMSPGKLAAQVAHASMAFLTIELRKNAMPVYNCEILPCRKEAHYRMYRHPDLNKWSKEAFEQGKDCFAFRRVETDDPYGKLELCEPEIEKYQTEIEFDADTYENWINGAFTKTVCQAKNKNQLLKAVNMAEELSLKEGKDFFLIRDNCYTELEPEEFDENGQGRVLTCIGFRPLPDEIAHKISRKYHLYV